MDTTPGNTLLLGDGTCWTHNGIYLGKFVQFKLIGLAHDPDPEYTFEKGIVSGLGLKFTAISRSSS